MVNFNLICCSEIAFTENIRVSVVSFPFLPTATTYGCFRSDHQNGKQMLKDFPWWTDQKTLKIGCVEGKAIVVDPQMSSNSKQGCAVLVDAKSALRSPDIEFRPIDSKSRWQTFRCQCPTSRLPGPARSGPAAASLWSDFISCTLRASRIVVTTKIFCLLFLFLAMKALLPFKRGIGVKTIQNLDFFFVHSPLFITFLN